MLAHNRFLLQKAAEVKLDVVLPLGLIVILGRGCTHGMAWPCGSPACNTGDIPSGIEGQIL